MPRALQTSGMAVPLASSASASRSLRMICSGEWRMRFIGSPPALTGENDSHIGWISLRGAGHRLTDHFADRLCLESLPPWAPMLNPTEPLWGWLKYDRLCNYAPHDVAELDGRV